jgi:hypothetical protein
MYNPNDVSDTKGVTYGSIEVPGASHPIYQFGAGGERLISFDLYVDGDRGRFGRQQARDTSSLSIMDELLWYRSLEYPQQYFGLFANVFPPLILYNDGPLYKNIRCLVKKADWHVTYWTPKREPVRAIISMGIAEVPTVGVTSQDVISSGLPTSFEF